jgi:hypothetical protein
LRVEEAAAHRAGAVQHDRECRWARSLGERQGRGVEFGDEINRPRRIAENRFIVELEFNVHFWGRLIWSWEWVHSLEKKTGVSYFYIGGGTLAGTGSVIGD